MVNLQMYDIDGNPLPGSFNEQLMLMSKIDRLVARTQLSNGHWISTILLPMPEQGAHDDEFYLFETAIFQPNQETEIIARATRFDKAYDFHCRLVNSIISNSQVTVVKETFHERIATPRKQDFTIHI
jgi:hypothetical protein